MWNGTEEAFEAILHEYQPILYGTAFTYLNSNAEIDDVVQETFIEFYYKYDTIRDKTKIGAWLCGVCRNIALKRLRTTRFTLGLDQATHKTTADPADLYEKVDLRRTVRKAIGCLPQPVAETVSLYYFAGQSVAKIAELLGIPQGTVKSRLYEGRRKLKGELQFMMKFNLNNQTNMEEKIRKILHDAKSAMENGNDNAAFLILDNAIHDIEEKTEHYRILAELYQKRGNAGFMDDPQKSREDDARALDYARLTGDEVLIAKYMLNDAYNAKEPAEVIEKMRTVYELAKRNNLNGVCAEAVYWEGIHHIRMENEPAARKCLNLALDHYKKIDTPDRLELFEGNGFRVRAFAEGALKSLDMLCSDVGRTMGDWESCNTFCQLLHRDGESVTIHMNCGWNIPGRQFNYSSIYGVYDGQGYLFAEDLLENDTATYEYYNFSNLPVKMTYTVLSRDEEFTTPAGHFTGCYKIRVLEELSETDAADPSNRESVENLCEYIFTICPGIGLLAVSCTYIHSPEQNAQFGHTSILNRYTLVSTSTHVLPLEEGNEFEYICFTADGTPASEKMTYRDIYYVDTVTSDGDIYLANYGYGYFAE